MSDERREQLKQSLRSELEQAIEERIDRYLSLNHQWLMPSHHFSYASSECLGLYRDGRFLSCVMVTQAISEAIVRLVAERNGVAPQNKETKHQLAVRMQQADILTSEFVEAFVRIQGSHRNDFHHMNPPIANIDIAKLAQSNVSDLIAMQTEVFGFTIREGMIVPKQNKYWDFQPGGMTGVRVLGN